MEKRKIRRISKFSHLSFEQLCARVTDVLLAQLNLQKTFMAKALKTLSLKVKNSAKGIKNSPFVGSVDQSFALPLIRP